MQRCLVYLSLVLIIGGFFSPALYTTAQASPPASPYSGLDVLLLVDQSGSMFGYYKGAPIPKQPATDQNGLRFQAPQAALQFLGTFRQQIGLASAPDIQMALVAFGTTPRLL